MESVTFVIWLVMLSSFSTKSVFLSFVEINSVENNGRPNE